MIQIYMHQTLVLMQATELNLLEEIAPLLIKKECRSGLVYFELTEKEDVAK